MAPQMAVHQDAVSTSITLKLMTEVLKRHLISQIIRWGMIRSCDVRQWHVRLCIYLEQTA